MYGGALSPDIFAFVDNENTKFLLKAEETEV